MRSGTRHLVGLGALAATMYFFDAVSGRRRRAWLRDQLASSGNHLADATRVTARDARQRARGVFAAVCGLFQSRDATEDVLVERVRSRLGRCVSHPGALETRVTPGGRVRISGPVLAREHARLLREVRSVGGVHDVEDHTVVYESGEHIPALQGGRPRQRRAELMQDNWSPTARLLVATLGTASLVAASRSRGPARLLGTAFGAALLTRSVANMPYRRLVSAATPREIDIHRSLQVQAAAREIFQLLANFENFPQFMRNIRSVRMNPDGSSRWIAAGPAGSSVKWTSTITSMEPDKALAWRTLPGSVIEHHGAIHLEPLDGGRCTRVDVRMNYRPPAGALGHVVARLFGADPGAELDQDLLRLKTFLETGKRPRDAAAQRPKGYVSGVPARRGVPDDRGITAVESSNQT